MIQGLRRPIQLRLRQFQSNLYFTELVRDTGEGGRVVELRDVLKEYQKAVLNGEPVVRDKISPFTVSSMLMRDAYYAEKVNKRMDKIAERYRWI